METLVTLKKASALQMPFEESTFDGAYMMHVGMNISNKEQLFHETFRILKKGSSLGIYDVMQTNENRLCYPVPWAENTESCFIAKPED